jgi:Mg-chelatase subunit ChlD
MQLANPWLLALLPLLLLLPKARYWRWRALALALFIVALSQPTLFRPSGAVAVLVDVSESVGDGAQQALAQFDFDSLTRPPDVFEFAGETARASDLEGDTAQLAPERTDLARALQVAAASGTARVLVISDGVESVGDALLALPATPVDTYAVPSRSNVRLASLLAPEQASPGETVEVTAVLESDQAVDVVLRPTVEGARGAGALEPIRTRLEPGRNPVRFQLPVREEGTVSVTARVDVAADQPTSDDAAAIDIAVSQEDPILVINDPAMAQLLTTQGFDVVAGDASSVTSPLPYSAIVVREGVRAFTPGQLELLGSYVDNGGGLMMTGGPESFGLGAWYRTPVEEVLPVSTDLRTDVQLPLVAMIIVMDRSQSMSAGRPSKISLAKEGAISVVELAYQEDRLGLITFSDQSNWVFELRPATDRGKLEMLNAILNIDTQGGTILRPAYELALETLRDSDASVKHVIILSDGQLYDGRGPFSSGPATDFAELATLGLEDGITTSTIALGEGADFERLESIARSGDGRYYSALDVSTLPRIFTNEALTATRALLRDGGFVPTARRHPLAPDITSAPPMVDAYVASSLKPEGEVILEGDSGEPILAVSRQGLGRSAAFTTDLNAWAGALGSWSELPAVIGTVTRWLQARPAEYSATVTPEGNRLKVVVDAVEDGQYINNEVLEARYQGSTQSLNQVAPGRYEALLASPPEGGTVLIVRGSEIVARARVNAPTAEFATGGAARLQQIASRSGGIFLPEPGRYDPDTPDAAVDIWMWFAGAGLLVFLLELTARRFAFLWQRREVSGSS